MHTEINKNLKIQEEEIENLKRRMILRGFQGDNIGCFGHFFEENLPFIEQIEQFLPFLEEFDIENCTIENIRKLIEVKKHLENFLHNSFEKHSLSFSDFLIPIHFSIIIAKNYIEDVLVKIKEPFFHIEVI